MFILAGLKRQLPVILYPYQSPENHYPRSLLLLKLLVLKRFLYHSHPKSLPGTCRDTLGVEVGRAEEVTESDTVKSLSLSLAIVGVGDTLTYSLCLLLMSVASSQAEKMGKK